MTIRVQWAAALALVAGAAAPLSAATVRTQNFVVDAPTQEAAQQFGRYAEYYRREKALLWLGKEMPPWPQPCSLRVTIQLDRPGGATEFDFDPQRGGVAAQRMHIEGPYERLLNSVLPHEVTHTVFAYRFGRPVPRWADEGGSVLSEDDTERHRHDGMCRSLLNSGRCMQLRTLFNLRDYPSDVMVLYAEGFSVSRYLVELRDRPTFLAFLGFAMQSSRPNGGYDWDGAVQHYYGVRSLEVLEKEWIDSLRKPRPKASDGDASASAGGARGDLTTRVATRDTSVPGLQLDAPVSRGQLPSTAESGRFGDFPAPPPGASQQSSGVALPTAPPGPRSQQNGPNGLVLMPPQAAPPR